MRNYTGIIVAFVVVIALLAYQLVQPEITVDEALFRQASLINIGEAVLYFTSAIAVFQLARYLRAKAGAERQSQLAQAQQLEFITRRFELDFGERSLYDPRPTK